MESSSRRNMLAATAAGGFLTASAAAAQTVEGIPQPRRPGHGGTDPSPRNLMRDGQNPDVLVPPSIDHGSLPNLRFSFLDASMARSFDFQADDLGYCTLRHGVLHREHRHHAAALSGDVQEQPLRRAVAGHMDGTDSTGIGAGASAARSASGGCILQKQGADRAGHI
jgi:hypothetical protein